MAGGRENAAALQEPIIVHREPVMRNWLVQQERDVPDSPFQRLRRIDRLQFP